MTNYNAVDVAITTCLSVAEKQAEGVFVPEGWIATTLGSLCSNGNGSIQTGPFGSQLHASDYMPSGVPVVNPTHLGSNAIDQERLPFVARSLADELAQHVLEKGDILIARRGDFSRFSYVSEQHVGWLCGTGCFRIRIRNTDVDTRFLSYVVATGAGQAYLAQNAVGTTMPNLNTTILTAFPVLLPPPPEQRTIARVLRSVQAAIQARRRAAALERERKAALMQHLFTHGTRGEATKLTEIGEMPESWRVQAVGELAAVAYGLTINEARRTSSNLAPYLTVANVTRGALRLEDVKRIGMVADDSSRYRLEPGDVLLVEGNGNPQLLGAAAVWNGQLPFVLHQNHLIRARPDQSRLLPEWLMGYLNSDDGRAQLLGRGKTSSGLHSINSRIVADLLIPRPSTDEQLNVVETMRACDSRVGALEYEATLHDELFRALLDDLTTGRLRVDSGAAPVRI